MNNELVSVVIPTYHRPDKLNKSVESVINQTYNNWELIIVDDNNKNDNYRRETEEFMEKYSSNKIIYIKHKKNKGGAAARNTGIKNAQGKYIAFLDDDDEWKPTKLKKMVKKIEKSSSDYGVVFSSYYVVTQDYIFQENQPKAEGDIHKKQLIKDHVSPTSTVLVKRECFQKAGYFDTKLPARQDYDMWIRISKFYKFTYLEEPLVYIYRTDTWDDGAISSNYENNLEGTKIILDKIQTELLNYSLDFKKRVYSSHYRYLGKMCYNFNNYNLGKKYLLKSLIKKFSFKTFFLYILSHLGPKTWNWVRKIKRKIS